MGSEMCIRDRHYTRQGRIDNDRCADYELQIHRLQICIWFQFVWMYDETRCTDADNRQMQTRTRVHFSCEVRRAITIGVHTLQMRKICGCKFVKSTHLYREWHTRHLSNPTRPQGIYMIYRHEYMHFGRYWIRSFAIC